MTLGSKLQSLRESQGLSQKELANLISVTTGIVAEWEADEVTPGLAELSRLSKALNVSPDVLLDAMSEATAPVVQFRQASTPVIAPAQKYTKIGWIIGTFLVGVLVVVAILLLSSLLGGRTSPTEETTVPTDPLAFVENTSAIEIADASVVTIFCYDYEGELAATGSGFVAFDSKTIITNYHVMTSAYNCKISTNQDISYEVSKILCYSKEQDIAILQLTKDTDLKPLTLGDSSIIKKGETVVAIGSPLGIKNTVSTGVLSGRLMEDGMDVLQFTAPISSGSSGGALFDNRGNVIGITFASYVDGQNLNLAIPIELAVKLYDTKSTTKSVSTICIEENPYIVHLEKYKNAPEVSVSELKSNPQKYDDQIVKLIDYISSCHDDYDDEDWMHYPLHISAKSDVTFDGEYDLSLTLNGRLNFEEIPTIKCLMADCILPVSSIKAGQKVVIIGKFSYTAKGEPLTIFDGTYDRSFGSLRAHLIYHSK